ncbi:MAG TPA: sulfite exporter TauE/SafE family protein [Candidatus Limnocylindrales bacterium]|nr:sulfite exporter TauE/SafE family protein [Candidatus Limnocylindrales bacterium]
MTTVLLAAAVGLLLGSALGLFGGGGGILAVPMLVGLLGMDIDQAATASLVIVLFGAFGGLVSHHRAGRVLWRAGLLVGATSIVGATVGSLLAASVDDWIKLSAFVVLMVAAGIGMLRNARRQPSTRPVTQPSLVGAGGSGDLGPEWDPGAALIDIPAADLPTPGPAADTARSADTARWPDTARWADEGAPDTSVPQVPEGSPAGSPSLAYSIPLLVLLATATGLVTGFLGVGGGFLVVPALVLSLRMPVANATATGLVVIAIASTSALLVRLTHSGALDEPALTAGIVVATVIASLLAARFSGRMSPRALGTGFAVLVLAMSALVAAQAFQAFQAA